MRADQQAQAVDSARRNRKRSVKENGKQKMSLNVEIWIPGEIENPKQYISVVGDTMIRELENYGVALLKRAKNGDRREVLTFDTDKSLSVPYRASLITRFQIASHGYHS